MVKANEKSAPGIIAHRGAPTRYPENSLAGYKAVLNMAMLYPQQKIFIEVDVRTTKDKVAIALHDSRINRTLEGQGECFDYKAEKLLAIPCRPVAMHKPDSELDFDAIKAQRQSDAPLWEIEKPQGRSPGDYRVASIEEILELARKTNKYLIKVGRPVGICLDLKAPQVLPALVKTLNDFAQERPNAIIPMIALGVTSRVGKRDMKKEFWNRLDEGAQRYFFETPEQIRQAKVHATNLHTTPGKGYAKTVARWLSTNIMNMLFPWHLIGDHNMIGVQPEHPGKGLRVAGNNYCMRTVEEVRRAAHRQDLIWVDNVWDAVQTLQQLQEIGQVPLAAPHRYEWVHDGRVGPAVTREKG